MNIKKSKKDKVSMLIKTNLKYDDRLRKECLTVKKQGKQVEIIGVLDQAQEGQTTHYGVSCRKIGLISRAVFNSKSALYIKGIELYMRSIIKILKSRPDIVWLHNRHFALFIPFLSLLRNMGVIRKIVWDQHELRELYISTEFGRRVYKWICQKCDKVIMANEERKQYVCRNVSIKHDNIIVLKNYPDKTFLSKNKDTLPKPLSDWLGASQYILAQGGANPGRYLNKLIDVFVNTNLSYKLVVVGPYQDSVMHKLKSKWGTGMKNRVFFTGGVPQLEMTYYIDNANASIIMYNKDNINSDLCAPNRLYQAIVRETPIICGNNKTLKKVVGENKIGVVMSSDGREKESIYDAVLKFDKNKSMYKDNVRKVKHNFIWDKQSGVISEIF